MSKNLLIFIYTRMCNPLGFLFFAYILILEKTKPSDYRKERIIDGERSQLSDEK